MGELGCSNQGFQHKLMNLVEQLGCSLPWLIPHPTTHLYPFLNSWDTQTNQMFVHYLLLSSSFWFYYEVDSCRWVQWVIANDFNFRWTSRPMFFVFNPSHFYLALFFILGGPLHSCINFIFGQWSITFLNIIMHCILTLLISSIQLIIFDLERWRSSR